MQVWKSCQCSLCNGVPAIRTGQWSVTLAFHQDAKAREDWTEEEVKEAAEYDQKVVQLEADREKYKKMLEQELKKLLVTVQVS